VANNDSRSHVDNLLSRGFSLVGIAGIVDDAESELLPQQATSGVNFADGALDTGRVVDPVRRF
jgi:hypothetical protein